MILLFEQDVRRHDGRRFTLKPGVFRGHWGGRLTWRVWWGLWSLSYYPSPGIKDFLAHVEKNQQWYDSTAEAMRE